MAVPQKKDNTSDAHSHQSPTEIIVILIVSQFMLIPYTHQLLGFICGANFGNNGVFVELTLNRSVATKGASMARDNEVSNQATTTS
ncbi:hypothetical protein E2562_036062 [Oryza meyeriana var. granulata]|uniref:Uncharacterized protein n=1 Tax=Oryza meyeriana var. granulata TaxID=110450 RepID=A0A6G1D9I3_9ORYZ|nr:hypothetical protein E2562_036062 [Oryza meyeriana var. granulata]